jgi:SAM-dependent methyltransferase
MTVTRTYRHPSFGTVSLENGWTPAPGFVLRRHRVMATLGAERPGALLEIGCGAGALVHDLQRMGFSCTALEMGDAAREIAQKICADEPEIRIHGEPSTEWTGRFDYVAAFEVLEHIEDDLAALTQWANWLKPTGKLYLSVPRGPERWNASDVWAGHFRRYTRESLSSVVAKAGLELRTLETYGFPLSNLIEPVRAINHARQLKRRGEAAKDKHVGSVHSGIERTLETRLFPLQASWLGERMMGAFCELQTLFRHRELGTGFLITATRKA